MEKSISRKSYFALYIKILHAYNLHRSDGTSTVSPYLSGRLIIDGSEIKESKKKTKVGKGGKDPEWNDEILEFSFPQLNGVTLMFKVYDTAMVRDEYVGSFSFRVASLIEEIGAAVDIVKIVDIDGCTNGRVKLTVSYVPPNGVTQKFRSEDMRLRPPMSFSAHISLQSYKQQLEYNDPQTHTQESKLKTFKEMVSLKKKRFKNEKYDLDLAYITDRIIAMGFPSSGVEKMYRNNIDDIRDFLTEYHPDAYKVYNLCSERSYPHKFFYKIALYPFDDHNVPTLEMIRDFVNDACDWLKKSENNVVAVHCKAGKGRTGTMICALLAFKYADKISTADALEFYAERRTMDRKGVTIPSQKRFVNYFGEIFKSPEWNMDSPNTLIEIVLENFSKFCP